MYAMQYEIALPADYDANVIRDRVATKAGPLLDNFPGLGLKAYLLRERGVDEAPTTLYAPFYLWASIAGMNRFLWGGGGFSNIVSFIRRPPVLHWTGVACLLGPAPLLPALATKVMEPIPAESDPAAAVEKALRELDRRAQHPEVQLTALAVDPQSWTILHFTLWRERTPETRGELYQVLYLSKPDLRDIVSAT